MRNNLPGMTSTMVSMLLFAPAVAAAMASSQSILLSSSSSTESLAAAVTPAKAAAAEASTVSIEERQQHNFRLQLKHKLEQYTGKTTQGGVVQKVDNRQLQGDNGDDDGVVTCPKGIWFCDDPENLPGNDPTIQCDPDTCAWDLSALDPAAPPKMCESITINPSQVDTLVDFLEPCLWWSMLYGNLQPTSAPSVTMRPTDTMAPSSFPTIAPTISMQPVDELSEILNETMFNGTWADGNSTDFGNFSYRSGFDSDDNERSDGFTLAQGEESPINSDEAASAAVATKAPNAGSGSSSSSSSSTSTVGFDTNLLTFYFQQPAMERRSLVRIQKPVEGSAGNSDVARRLQNNEGQLQQEPDLDRVELHVLTSEHVLIELRKLIGNEELVQRLNLVITAVQAARLNSSTTTSTEAIDGQVVLAHEQGSSLQPATLQSMMQSVFSGDALVRYVELLQTKASSGSVLASVQQVVQGLPLDVMDAYGTSTRSTPWGNSSSQQPLFAWNTFWIAIIAGGGVGLIGLVIGCCFLCRRMYCSSSSRLANTSLEDISDDEIQRKLPGVTPTSSSETKRTSASTGSKPQCASAAAVGRNAGRKSGRKHASHKVSTKLLQYDLDDEDDDEESKAGRRYTASEATSVYSYIDANLNDDQSYSVAPSMMYGNVVSDDQSFTSRMWSVVDGIANQSTINNLPASAVATSRRSRDEIECGDGDGGDNESLVVPTRMIVTQQRQTESGVMIFADGDDELSLVSENNTTRNNSLNNTPERNGSKSRIMATNNLISANAGGKNNTSLETIDGPFVPANAKHAMNSGIINNNNKSTIFNPSPNVKLHWSINDYTHDEGSQASDLESAVAGQRLPFVNTSKLDDSATSKVNTSMVSDSSAGTKVSQSTPKTKNAPGHNPFNDHTESTDGESRRSGAGMIQTSESSDDESSLFMGPTSLGSGSTAGDGRVISLTASKEVEKDENDAFRIGPMVRGNQNLTPQEKKHLGLSVRHHTLKKNASDEEEQGEANIHLPNPYNKKSPSADKKQADSSITVANKSPIENLASF